MSGPVNQPEIIEREVWLPSVRRLRFLQAGQGRVGVLFLSGLGPTADFWRWNLPALAAPGRSAVALDTPGFGGSVPLARSSLAGFARAAYELSEALAFKKVVLVGNSLGGALALEYYLNWPEQVAGLVLVDAFGANAQVPFRLSQLWRNMLPSLYLWLFGRAEWPYRQVLNYVFYKVPPGVDELFRFERGPSWTLSGAVGRAKVALSLARELGLARQRRRFLRRLGEQASRYPVPTQIIWGDRDQTLSPVGAYEFKNAVPTAEVLFFEDCGHHPPAERARDFNEILGEWLDTLTTLRP